MVAKRRFVVSPVMLRDAFRLVRGRSWSRAERYAWIE